jgi:hypothetical protein
MAQMPTVFWKVMQGVPPVAGSRAWMCGNLRSAKHLALVWPKSDLEVPTLPENASTIDRAESAADRGEPGIYRAVMITTCVPRYHLFSGLYTRLAGKGPTVPVCPVSPIPGYLLCASRTLLIS